MAKRGFRHEALFYPDEDGFLAGALPFIRNGVAAGEPIMVTVDRGKIELLRSRLIGSADRVKFVDIHAIGRNPAVIIPAWQDFVAENARDGRQLRGIGEPVWPERSPAELAECDHHESLLNLAFDDGPSWRLMCPYDTSALDASVLAGAKHNHRFIDEDGDGRESREYREPADTRAPFSGRLAEPPVTPDEMAFESPGDLGTTRRFVGERAAAAGIDPERANGLVLAVDEVVTNALRHGGGTGLVRSWSEDGGLVCEVSDAGTISDPLVGRKRPTLEQRHGRGLWIANHFCDLVQIRSSRRGTVIRCHLGPRAAAVPV